MERDQQTPSTRGTQAHTDGRTPNGTEPTVVLKKYGNRRLYDTTASRYVTLVEVEAMVQQGTDILVVDARSGEDITREVLVQLLLERDSARASLPTGLLKQAVRLANSPLKEGLVKAMQEGLDTFMSGQRAVADAQRAITTTLSSSLTPWLPTTTPVPMWNPFPPPPPPGTQTAPAAAPPAPVAVAPVAPAASSPSSPSELESLRAELGQTQALVRQLLERELARTAHEASTTTTTQAPASTSTSTKKPARKKKS